MQYFIQLSFDPQNNLHGRQVKYYPSFTNKETGPRRVNHFLKVLKPASCRAETLGLNPSSPDLFCILKPNNNSTTIKPTKIFNML